MTPDPCSWPCPRRCEPFPRQRQSPFADLGYNLTCQRSPRLLQARDSIGLMGRDWKMRQNLHNDRIQ